MEQIKSPQKLFIDTSLIHNLDIYESVKDIANCIICSGVVIEPLQCTKCELTFCKACINVWKTKSESCPMRCSESEIKEASRVVRSMLSKLIILCPWGCPAKVPYEEIINHEGKCDSELISCPMCKTKVSKNEINKKSYDQMRIELEIMEKKYAEIKIEVEELRSLKKQESQIDKNSSYKENYSKGYREEKRDNKYQKEYNPDSVYNSILSKSIAEPLQNSALYTGKKYDGPVVSDDTCKHVKSTFSSIFDCCDKGFPCKMCHNIMETHKRGRNITLYCKKCFAICSKLAARCSNQACLMPVLYEKLGKNRDYDDNRGEKRIKGEKRSGKKDH